ncbi:MAG: mycothiol transferase, partial [Nocardioides sp.]
ALVEDWWFSCVLLGREYAAPFDAVDWRTDADWDWHSAAQDSPAELRALLDRCIAASDAALDSVPDWSTPSVRTSRTGERFSVRWIVAHLVEEYARHNGHADLLREAIAGSTGERASGRSRGWTGSTPARGSRGR